jgi:hypothetical protein
MWKVPSVQTLELKERQKERKKEKKKESKKERKKESKKERMKERKTDFDTHEILISILIGLDYRDLQAQLKITMWICSSHELYPIVLLIKVKPYFDMKTCCDYHPFIYFRL